MTFLDFFSGIGGFRSGFEKAGHKCVGFCEWDKYARQSYKAIYNTEGEWESHDVRGVSAGTLPRADIWCFGFPCFAKDTLVLTDKGYIPIQDIKRGDFVLTHKGNWKPVTQVMTRDNAELWSVTGFGILPTVTTAEHPYYVEDNGELKFVPIKSLTETMMSTMVLPDVNTEDKHSKAWWWLVGRYLADGWTVTRKDRPRGGRVVIACNDKKALELEKHIVSAGYHFTKSKETTCNKYIICNNQLYDELQSFGKYAYGKRLPRFVLELPSNKAECLWDGYMSGDGRYDKIEATSVSGALLLGLSLIAVRIGYSHPALYKTKRKKECFIQGRLCKQRDIYTLRCAKTKGYKSYVRTTDGVVCRTIDRPKQLGTTGTVYNISVQDDESYIANGAIVHNCQDISVAGKQKGLQAGERSGLFYEIIRLLAGSKEEDKPEWLVCENVKNLLSIGNGFDFARLLFELGGGWVRCRMASVQHKIFVHC